MRASHKAWCALGLGVVIYDILSPPGETMSEAFDGWMDGKGKTYASLGVVVLAMHLLNLVDPKHDPLHLAFTVWKVPRVTNNLHSGHRDSPDRGVCVGAT